jgi:hypothetical protein
MNCFRAQAWASSPRRAGRRSRSLIDTSSIGGRRIEEAVKKEEQFFVGEAGTKNSEECGIVDVLDVV